MRVLFDAPTVTVRLLMLLEAVSGFVVGVLAFLGYLYATTSAVAAPCAVGWWV